MTPITLSGSSLGSQQLGSLTRTAIRVRFRILMCVKKYLPVSLETQDKTGLAQGQSGHRGERKLFM
jgi:hypothetical protein